jgi:predicted Fe-S protein YdhL (DUF1289 family)
VVARHSPCLGICQLDEATGFCIGCGRSGGEIGEWISMNDADRDQVWAKLPERRAALSIRVQLQPWTRNELIQWAKRTISDRLGTWVTGAPGAVAEFPCTAERDIDVKTTPDAIIGRASDASFRLHVSDKVRAFTFANEGAVVLGLPKARARLKSNSVLQDLGDDADAIDGRHRDEKLFDLGIGRKGSRFCIRTADMALAKTVSEQTGRHWSEVMPAIGTQLRAGAPTRIVESAAARIEVFAPIPISEAESPSGAHIRFLPNDLKSGEEIPASLALPEFALPVAIFYPHTMPA